MTPERREILEQVARGDLTPEQAEDLLSGLEEPSAPAPEVRPSGIRAVKVSAGFGAIVVEGDASVTEAEIDGPHSASIDGDTLVVQADNDPDLPGVFEINLGGRHQRHRRVRAFGLSKTQGGPASSLRIRMNPTLALDARLDAGSLSVIGMHGTIRARSSAGPITIEGSRSPLDLSVNAGAIRVVGILKDGDSRIRSDAGAVRVELDPASSVTIIAEAALGKVQLPGEEAPAGRRFGSRSKATIGDGAATLRVETAMGSIHVSTTS